MKSNLKDTEKSFITLALRINLQKICKILIYGSTLRYYFEFNWNIKT